MHVLLTRAGAAKVVGFVQERHVGFDDSALEGARPNRLQRRDTPHHLKNKRINQLLTLDNDKVAAIIASVRHQCDAVPKFH